MIKVLLSAKNDEGKKLLQLLVEQWGDRETNKSFLRNIIAKKIQISVDSEEPYTIDYHQPDFDLYKNNNKTRRVLEATIYSQFKSNGITEDNVGVMFK